MDRDERDANSRRKLVASLGALGAVGLLAKSNDAKATTTYTSDASGTFVWQNSGGTGLMQVDSNGIHDLRGGMGNSTAKNAPAADLNAILESGIYGFQYSVVANGPRSPATYAAVFNASYYPNTRAQLFFNTTPGVETAAYLRQTDDWTVNTTTWRPWAKVQLGSALYVAAFGAQGYDPNTTTPGADETAKIQGAIDSAYAAGGGTILLDQSRKYYVNGALVIKSGVTLAGHIDRPEFRRDVSAVPVAGDLDILRWGSQLVLGTGGSITLKSSAGIRNCVVMYAGVTSVPTPRTGGSNLIAAFSTTQTAITLAGEGCLVRDVFVGGFNLAVYSQQARPVIDGVWGDNYNGVLVENADDVARIQNCHFWPWLTITSTEPDGAGNSLRRTGASNYAYTIRDTQGGKGTYWARFHNCFCFGYQYGFWMQGGDSTLLSMCGADNTPGNPGSIAYVLTSNANATRIDMCQGAAHQTGVWGEVKGGPKKKVFLTNSDFWGNAVGFNSGLAECTTRINACSFSACPTTAINVAGTAARVHYRDCMFHDNTNTVLFDGQGQLVDDGGNLAM
jgi:hypothetical protein